MVIACALVLTACGDDEPEPAARTTPQPTATASPAPTASPTVEPTASPTAAPTEEAGDEEGGRVRQQFDLAIEDVVPAQATVPAFLGLEFELTNVSGNERIVRLDGKVIAELAPGEALKLPVEGLQPGEHILSAGESGRATIVAERAG